MGFDQPFEMLEACHERVLRMLALLDRLRVHLRTKDCDDSARQAARDILRYFDQAAPLHHEDEELHVFPPLLEQGDAQTVALVQRLQREHGLMSADWALARLTRRCSNASRPAMPAMSRMKSGWPTRRRAACCQRQRRRPWAARWPCGGARTCHGDSAAGSAREPARRYSQALDLPPPRLPCPSAAPFSCFASH